MRKYNIKKFNMKKIKMKILIMQKIPKTTRRTIT